MAKAKVLEAEDAAKAIPQRRWKKGQKTTAKMYRGMYDNYKNARAGSCYWPQIPSEASGGTMSSDWVARWNLQEKLYNQFFEVPSADDYLSNVKSPMTFGRVEMVMQKLRGQAIGFAAYPGSPDDKQKALIAELLLNSWFENMEVGAALFTAEKDAIIHGCSFPKVVFVKKKRVVRIPLTSATKMTSDEKRRLKSGEVIYREVEIDDFDDVAIVPTKIQSIYIDPSARNMHGPEYEAQVVFERMVPSIDQFKAMFEDDPDAQNIDMVRPSTYYNNNEDAEFFLPPHDVDSDDYVEVLHVWDKKNDRYVVLANDVVIKDIPLPYAHKQLPFVKLTAVEYPHQMYDIGLPDILLALQTEEENLKNMIYDHLHLTGNPMMKVRDNIYGQFSRLYSEGRPGLMLPVKDQADVEPLTYAPLQFDFYRALDIINRDAVIGTQLDPTQLGVQQKYVSATTSMLTKEVVDAFINNLIKSFSVGLTQAAYQVYELMKQYYTVPKVEQIAGETIKKAHRKMNLRGVKINVQSGAIERGKTSDMAYGVEIKKELVDTKSKIDLKIRPESLEVTSPAIQIQKVQTALAQLSSLMVDPTNEESMRANPNGVVDIRKAVQDYLEANSLPVDWLIEYAEDDEETIKRAELQNKAMLEEQSDIPGIPGEAHPHKFIHYKLLMELTSELSEVVNKLMTGEVAPKDMPVIEEMQKVVERVKGHLAADDAPKQEQEQLAIEKATSVTAPPQMPMPPSLTPQGAPGAPIPMGGNQGLGALGETMFGGAGGNTGRPPMAEAGLPMV